MRLKRICSSICIFAIDAPLFILGYFVGYIFGAFRSGFEGGQEDTYFKLNRDV